MRKCVEKDGGPPGVPASERWKVNVKRVWRRTFGAAAEFPGGLRSEPMFMAVGGAVSSSGVFKHQRVLPSAEGRLILGGGGPWGYGGTYKVVKTFFIGWLM